MPTRKLENLLNASAGGDLADLIGRAQKMGVLTDTIARALPESERHSVVAANVRKNGELIVICASSAWASRLRFETDKLLQAARDSGIEVRTCRIRVQQG